MKEVAHLLNAMLDAGIIQDYAVFGAMAQMRYTDAVATMDADILVSLPDPDRMDILTPVYEFCRRRGMEAEREFVRVGTWPVQFVPTFNSLTQEALENAEKGAIDDVPIKVITADYLAALALQTGRPKDFVRIIALHEANAIDLAHVGQIAGKHDLSAEWNECRRKYVDEEQDKRDSE